MPRSLHLQLYDSFYNFSSLYQVNLSNQEVLRILQSCSQTSSVACLAAYKKTIYRSTPF